SSLRPHTLPELLGAHLASTRLLQQFLWRRNHQRQQDFGRFAALSRFVLTPGPFSRDAYRTSSEAPSRNASGRSGQPETSANRRTLPPHPNREALSWLRRGGQLPAAAIRQGWASRAAEIRRPDPADRS